MQGLLDVSNRLLVFRAEIKSYIGLVGFSSNYLELKPFGRTDLLYACRLQQGVFYFFGFRADSLLNFITQGEHLPVRVEAAKLVGSEHTVGTLRSEYDMNTRAAGEFDRVFTVCGFVAAKKDRPAAYHHQYRYHPKDRTLAEPVDVGFPDKLHHKQFFADDFAVGQEVKYHSRHKQSSEHTADDPDHQSQGKTLDLFRSQYPQNQSHKESSSISVHNRAEGPIIPVFDCDSYRRASHLLLADTFENKHVGIDGHTNSQDQAGHAGHSECRPTKSHHANNQQHVHKQCRGCERTGN